MSSLWGSRQRTLLSTIGIVIGSGSVIAMINIGQMVQEDAMRAFEKLGPDMIHLQLSEKSISYDIVSDLRDTLAGRSVITPVLSNYVSWRYAHSSGKASIVGVDKEFSKVVGEQLAQGRLIGRLEGNELFAVLGSVSLKGKDGVVQPELMEQVQIKGVMLSVVGKLKHYGDNPMLGFNVDAAIFVPIGSYRRFSSNADIRNLLIKVNPGQDVELVVQQAKEYLESKVRGIRVRAWLAQQEIESIKHQSKLITMLLGTMGSISLLVGGIGIMNMMLVSMTERRKEIGLRMALGATKRSIIGLFLIESAVLTTLGGVLGLVLGVGAAILVGYFTGVTYFFSTLAAALGVGVSAIVGIFFGYYPALAASRLNPIDALNTE
ncbi:MAG: FtsX-like permease family protein [Gammaproteobacteria bacterium]|nr:FtsX-like permease family protein [Gammaproteobacteria bacterium]